SSARKEAEPLEAFDRLIRAAAAKADEELTSRVCDLLGACRAVAPAEGCRRRAERRGVLYGKRLLLVAEDRGREEIEEAMVVARAHGLVQSGGRLEGNLEPATGLHESREVWNPGEGCAAAAHLRTDPELAELEDAE